MLSPRLKTHEVSTLLSAGPNTVTHIPYKCCSRSANINVAFSLSPTDTMQGPFKPLWKITVVEIFYPCTAAKEILNHWVFT